MLLCIAEYHQKSERNILSNLGPHCCLHRLDITSSWHRSPVIFHRLGLFPAVLSSPRQLSAVAWRHSPSSTVPTITCRHLSSLTFPTVPYRQPQSQQQTYRLQAPKTKYCLRLPILPSLLITAIVSFYGRGRDIFRRPVPCMALGSQSTGPCRSPGRLGTLPVPLIPPVLPFCHIILS